MRCISPGSPIDKAIRFKRFPIIAKNVAPGNEPAGTTKKGCATMTNKRWLFVVLMFASSTLGYLDRAAIGIAAPLITKDLTLSPSQMGMAFSAFFFGYSVFAFIGGRGADRFGTKRVIVVSMALWSIFCGLTAAAGSLVFLVVVRLLFGAGEGPLPPSLAKMAGRWFPRKEQATVIGLYGAGEAIGGALAGPIVGFIAVAVSWRLSFVVIAIIGLALSLVWVVAASEWPEEHRLIGAAEKKYIIENRASEIAPVSSDSTPSRSLVATCFSGPVLATAIAWFGYAYILFFFLSWFPSYLSSTYHLSMKDIGLISMLPWLAGFVARTGSGYVSDVIFRRTGNALLARKLILCVGLGVSAVCIALAGTAADVGTAVALTTVSVFFLAATANMYWVLMLDLVPQQYVGGAGGFGLLIGSSAGIFAPMITGFLVQWSGTYMSAFVISGAVAVVGVLAVALFVRH
jgi:sugar phosphate permease